MKVYNQVFKDYKNYLAAMSWKTNYWYKVFHFGTFRSSKVKWKGVCGDEGCYVPYCTVVNSIGLS